MPARFLRGSMEGGRKVRVRNILRHGEERSAGHCILHSHIFGYYLTDDEAVLRKHAQMLADAGVDVVIFDVTNQASAPSGKIGWWSHTDDVQPRGQALADGRPVSGDRTLRLLGMGDGRSGPPTPPGMGCARHLHQ